MHFSPFSIFSKFSRESPTCVKFVEKYNGVIGEYLGAAIPNLAQNVGSKSSLTLQKIMLAPLIVSGKGVHQ